MNARVGGVGPPRRRRAVIQLQICASIAFTPERELSSELHYSGVSRRGLFSKAIRLGLYTCILYVCIHTHTHTYIYGFLVCRYARSLNLPSRQNTPAIDGAFYRPNGTSYQLQPSFHTQSTEPEPTARARRAGEEFY